MRQGQDKCLTAPLTHRMFRSQNFLGVFLLLSFRVFRLPFVAVFFPRLSFLCWCRVLWSVVRLLPALFLGCAFWCLVGAFCLSSFPCRWFAVFCCLFLSALAVWFFVSVVVSAFGSAVASFLSGPAPFLVSRRSGSVLFFWVF